jgi:hypothetical protein
MRLHKAKARINAKIPGFEEHIDRKLQSTRDARNTSI